MIKKYLILIIWFIWIWLLWWCISSEKNIQNIKIVNKTVEAVKKWKLVINIKDKQ